MFNTPQAMNIKVKFFGALAELTGVSEWSMQGSSTDDCMRQILERYPLLHGQSFALALNARMIKENQGLQDGDVLALLPPFSGG